MGARNGAAGGSGTHGGAQQGDCVQAERVVTPEGEVRVCVGYDDVIELCVWCMLVSCDDVWSALTHPTTILTHPYHVLTPPPKTSSRFVIASHPSLAGKMDSV